MNFEITYTNYRLQQLQYFKPCKFFSLLLQFSYFLYPINSSSSMYHFNVLNISYNHRSYRRRHLSILKYSQTNNSKKHSLFSKKALVNNCFCAVLHIDARLFLPFADLVRKVRCCSTTFFARIRIIPFVLHHFFRLICYIIMT